MNLNLNLIENKKCINWMNRCNALFIVKDYSDFKRSGYVKDFKKIYKCVDTKPMKEDELELFLKKKTNINRYIIEYNHDTIKHIIDILSKFQFMSIPLYLSIHNYDFIGWFWNNFFQKKLHYYRRKFFKQIMEIKSVNDQLKSSSNELETFWVKQTKRLHVTAMFIGHQANDKSENYLEKVSKQFYTTTKAKVTGILLTPRNISGHVVIPEDVKYMFNPDQQDEFNLLTHVTLATSKIGKPVDSGPDQIIVQTMIKEKKTPIQEFNLEIGKLQDWGECRFYVVLKRALNYELMFMPTTQ